MIDEPTTTPDDDPTADATALDETATDSASTTKLPEADAAPDPEPVPAAEPAPTAVAAAPVGSVPAERPAFDKRTAGITLIGISALLIAFFSGYALGGHHDESDGPERMFQVHGERGSMPMLPGAPRGGDFRGPHSAPGAGGEYGQRGRGTDAWGRGERRGAVGTVTDVDGDEVTVEPLHGGDEVTVPKDEVRIVGGGSDADEDDVEEGDIVIVRTPAEPDSDDEE